MGFAGVRLSICSEWTQLLNISVRTSRAPGTNFSPNERKQSTVVQNTMKVENYDGAILLKKSLNNSGLVGKFLVGFSLFDLAMKTAEKHSDCK